MDNSPLGRLPAEVRNLIYEYALQHWEPFELSLTPHRSGHRLLRQPWWADTPKHCLALSATCKQIRAECLSMFFPLNEFEIRGIVQQEVLPCLQTFRTEIVGRAGFENVRSVTLVLKEHDIPLWTNDRDGFMRYLAHALRLLQWAQNNDRAVPNLRMKCGVSYAVGIMGSPNPTIRVLRMTFDMVDLAGSWRAMMSSIDEEIKLRPTLFSLPLMRSTLRVEKANFERYLGFDASLSAKRG